MSKRQAYTNVKVFEKEILDMKQQGRTHKEIAEHLNLRDKYVVKEFLKRQKRMQNRLEAGVPLKLKGRPRINSFKRDITVEQEYEIKRLRMENELLRDFLHLAGRK